MLVMLLRRENLYKLQAGERELLVMLLSSENNFKPQRGRELKLLEEAAKRLKRMLAGRQSN